MTVKLYDYWRSSSAYRVRIALNLKQVAYDSETVDLHPAVRAHLSPSYQAINAQMRVPAVALKEGVFGQSMAILEWIDETWPTPPLLPRLPLLRLRARAFAQTISSDIQPLNTPAVLDEIRTRFGAGQDGLDAWYAHWIRRGFLALEADLPSGPGRFLFGDAPTLAEITLVPQMYNARRFNVDLTDVPGLVDIDAACRDLPAFAKAAPEAVRTP